MIIKAYTKRLVNFSVVLRFPYCLVFRKRLESLNQGMEKRKKEETQEVIRGDPIKKKWFFW